MYSCHESSKCERIQQLCPVFQLYLLMPRDKTQGPDHATVLLASSDQHTDTVALYGVAMSAERYDAIPVADLTKCTKCFTRTTQLLSLATGAGTSASTQARCFAAGLDS